jgi:hypothetical protein
MQLANDLRTTTLDHEAEYKDTQPLGLELE